MPCNQKGIAHIVLIILAVFGIAIGLYLVQTRTNFLPKAQQEVNLTPQTAFHLLPAVNYYLFHKGQGSTAGGYGSNADTTSQDESAGGSGEIYPQRSWFYPGEEIKVNLSVSSDIEATNTFSAIINFPADLLEVVSIQKENNGPTPYDISPVVTETNSEAENGSKICAQVETKACGTVYNDCKPGADYACSQSEWAERHECKDFPTPCDVPVGWEIQDPNLKGKRSCLPDQSCPSGYYCKPLSICTEGGVCTDVVGGECYPNPSPVPSGSCRPRPACLDSEPRCLLPETSDICPPTRRSPTPSCKPIPSCVNQNPACDIYIDPNDPGWCHNQTLVEDYFIKYWLPDTKFDNQTGQVILSGGVSGSGIKTIPPNKPIMATIVFKAKKPGEAKLEFGGDSLILRNSDSENILTNKNGLTIQIQDPAKSVIKGDLDGDGVVGYKDFSILLSKWGTDDKKADINSDGKVNIYDFSILLTNWTGRKR